MCARTDTGGGVQRRARRTSTAAVLDRRPRGAAWRRFVRSAERQRRTYVDRSDPVGMQPSFMCAAQPAALREQAIASRSGCPGLRAPWRACLENSRAGVREVPRRSRWRRRLRCCRTHTTPAPRSTSCQWSKPVPRWRTRHSVTSTSAVSRAAENTRRARSRPGSLRPARVVGRPQPAIPGSAPTARPHAARTTSRASARRREARRTHYGPYPESGLPPSRQRTATAATG